VKEADSSLKVTTSFTVVPQLNLLDYIYRDQYFKLEGDGFGKSASIILMIREKTGGAGIDGWPAVMVTGDYFSTGDGDTKSHTNTLQKVPIKPGTFTVTDGVETFTDEGDGGLDGSSGGSGTVDYVTGEVHVKFKTAPAEDVIISCSYDQFEDTPEITFVTTKPVSASTKGSMHAEIEIEDLDYGEYYLCALDSLNNTMVQGLKLCPKITLSQYYADVGDLVTIKGKGFTPDTDIESVTISGEDWSGVECQIISSDKSTDSEGDLQIQVFIPQVPDMDTEYIVEVTASDGVSSMSSLVVHDLAYIECTVERDEDTYLVHLVGKNYQNMVKQKVDIVLVETDFPYHSYEISQVYTNENGVIDTTFVATTNDERRFTIKAYSDDANIESDAFLQISPLKVELSRDHGLPGETIKVTGDGFTPNKSWNATFDDTAVVSTEEGKVSSTGRLKLKTSSANFKVPEVDPDEYTMRFTDVDTGHSIDVTFTVDPSPMVTEDTPPIAVIDCEDTGLEGELFYFSGRGSADGDGVILYYLWEFGDGFSSNNMNPIHRYSTQGTYKVTLSVKDNDGLTDETSRTIQIKDLDARAGFTVINSEGFAPFTAQFQEASLSYDEVTHYEWDFGDGYRSNDRNPTHTYLEPGVYTVRLTITDVDGDTYTTTETGSVKVWTLDYESPEIRNAEAERLNETDVLVTAYVVDNQQIRDVSLVTDTGVYQLTESSVPGLYRCRASSFSDGKLVAEDVGGNIDEAHLQAKPIHDDALLTLLPGWNKVTIPLDCPETQLEDIQLTPLGLETVSILSQTTGLNVDTQPMMESVWTYNPFIGYMLYDPLTHTGEFDRLEPGRSYWIKVTDAYPVECLLTCS
jgi:PKD repeat protein